MAPATKKFSPVAQKLTLGLLVVLVSAYTATGLYIWHAMRQPPEVFGRVMARISGPAVFLLFPFETMWTKARAGTLGIGDAAPDFSLLKVDKSESIRLSALTRQQPVVLVFGSYT